MIRMDRRIFSHKPLLRVDPVQHQASLTLITIHQLHLLVRAYYIQQARRSIVHKHGACTEQPLPLAQRRDPRARAHPFWLDTRILCHALKHRANVQPMILVKKTRTYYISQDFYCPRRFPRLLIPMCACHKWYT